MATLFVAGHSDSDGRYLPAGAEPWTTRICDWLTASTGERWDLVAKPFFSMGPRAVSYLVDAVRDAGPDIVILPFGGYVCTVGVVAESVRVRFGERAHRLYLRTEASFEANTSEGRLRRLINRCGRSTARSLLGVRTLTTVEETTGIYEEILHRLASIESLQVVGVADARFSSEIQSREPRLHSDFDKMEARLKEVVDRHRFTWIDLEGALREAPDRSAFYLADGFHTTVAFHDLYFALIRKTLSESRMGAPS